MQSAVEQAQTRQVLWMSNLVGLEGDVRNAATEHQRAIGVAEHEWHQQRTQLESTIGSAASQHGGQQCIIDGQKGMMRGAGRYIDDFDARIRSELSTAVGARTNAARLCCESASREEPMRGEPGEASRVSRPSAASPTT